MSTPTATEREHYAKLVGRQITSLPILLLDGRDRDGGPKHFDHNL